MLDHDDVLNLVKSCEDLRVPSEGAVLIDEAAAMERIGVGEDTSQATPNPPLPISPRSSSITLLPGFRSCFRKHSVGYSREMRWGLWSPHDRDWMTLVEDNYERHHRKQSRPREAHNPRSAEAGEEMALGKMAVGQGETAGGGDAVTALFPRLHAPRGTCLIPRTIHQIWLGSPLPKRFVQLRESWRSRHQGWELRLWTNADVDAFGLENREAYDNAPNFGEKSDILRYEVLLRHGGLYVDVDFVCLGSLHELHERYDFYTGVSNTGTFELNNGLVGCRAGHPIMRDIVNRIGGSNGEKTPSAHASGSGTSHRHDPRDLPSGSASIDTSKSPLDIPDLFAAKSLVGRSGGTSQGPTPKKQEDFDGRAGSTSRKVVEAAISVKEGAPSSSSSTAAATTNSTPSGDPKGVGGFHGAGAIGDPFAALMGALGHSGQSNDGGGGLLQGLLGTEDCARLKEAIQVEKGSVTSTIVKTGPGVFTIAVLEWMNAAAATTAPSGTETETAPGFEAPPVTCTTETKHCSATGQSFSTHEEISASVSTQALRGTDTHTKGVEETGMDAANGLAMVLPPSFFYPVPNNVKGDSIGDGAEDGVRKRVETFFSDESLAAHLWAKSWQEGIR